MSERTCYGCKNYRIEPLTFAAYCLEHIEKGEIDPDKTPDWCGRDRT
jgi:hypothetical protein